ncbi:MAG: AAA family ATPase [Stenotrophobium sp.]
MSNAARIFTDQPAVAGPTPLLFGLIGPSGSGKTFSALRLATGMQRVLPTDIYLIDTEHGRAKHYANYFKFRHVPFEAPFSPFDYMAAVKHCLDKGAKIIIIDSLSHEHSGQGGCLEWHEQEVQRLMKAWNVNEDKANIPAWAKPKAARRQLINLLTQADAHIFECFRAKDKIKIGGGKVVQLGWMPDAGEEHVFELAAKSLLLPGAGGVPTWTSEQPGERMMIKLPEYFRTIFSGKDSKPLDEDIGQKLAEWAAGSAPVAQPTAMAVADIEHHVDAMGDAATLADLQMVFAAAKDAAAKVRDSEALKRFTAVKDLTKKELAAKGTKSETPVGENL